MIFRQHGCVSNAFKKIVDRLLFAQILHLKVAFFNIIDECVWCFVFRDLLLIFLVGLIIINRLCGLLKLLYLLQLVLSDQLLSHGFLIVV